MSRSNCCTASCSQSANQNVFSCRLNCKSGLTCHSSHCGEKVKNIHLNTRDASQMFMHIWVSIFNRTTSVQQVRQLLFKTLINTARTCFCLQSVGLIYYIFSMPHKTPFKNCAPAFSRAVNPAADRQEVGWESDYLPKCSTNIFCFYHRNTTADLNIYERRRSCGKASFDGGQFQWSTIVSIGSIGLCNINYRYWQ